MKSFNASNDPGTCLWCGDKLKHQYDTKKERIPGKTRAPSVCYNCRKAEGFKRHEDGTFTCKHCNHTQYGSSVSRVVSRERFSEKPGYHQSDCFCSCTCGFLFGVSLAGHGRRLTPKRKTS